MGQIRRATALLVIAPFTRQAWQDVVFCLSGALTGIAGFIVVAALLVPALVISGSVVGAVVGLPLAVAAIGLIRGSARCTAGRTGRRPVSGSQRRRRHVPARASSAG